MFSVDLFPEVYLLMNQDSFLFFLLYFDSVLIPFRIKMIYRCNKEGKKGNQLNEFGTMERGIEEVGNCGRVDIYATWELFSFGATFLSFLCFDIENIYSRKTSECFASNVDFIQIPLAFSFLVSPLFFLFFSFPFSHTVLSSSVDHLRL